MFIVVALLVLAASIRFGAIDFSAALAKIAAGLGYRVTIADPRRAFLESPRFAAFAEVAADRGVSPQRVALAWMLAKSPTVIPIPGSSRPSTIRDSVAAADLELSEDELTRLSS